VLGGEEMTGASRLAARAAQRVGAGLVTVAAPPAAWPVYAASLQSIMASPRPFAELAADERRNALLVGPGAGRGEATREAVLVALATRRAVVLDADALTAFEGRSETLFRAIGGPCVLTPHAGEFSRLFPFSGDRLADARAAAGASGAVVVLKGPDTVVAAPGGEAVVNANAPPSLAVGGSGDVLAGMVAGLLGRGMPAFAAAAAAVWLHGAAANVAGSGLVPEDLLFALRNPAVTKLLFN
jgi:ADP-dependent NAD(P)H-hydrate dehydratase / NAD(P)H-hydrate epimerase